MKEVLLISKEELTRINHDQFVELFSIAINDLKIHHVDSSDNDEIFIDKKEAARIGSVSTSSVDNWAREGHFDRHYFGGSVRFWKPEYMHFLKSRRIKVGSNN